MRKQTDFGAEQCQKYRLYGKKFQIKVVEQHCCQQMRESFPGYCINKLLIIFEQKLINIFGSVQPQN